MLLQRVSHAMPDIYMLMQHFHETSATLELREQHVRQLEAQRDADARRQDRQIAKLTHDIEALLAKHAAKVDRLELHIAKLEDAQSQLRTALGKETQLKDDTRAANDKLRAEQKQLALKYLDEKAHMADAFAGEKTRLLASSSAASHQHTKTLTDQLATQARIAESHLSARLADLSRLHDHDRKLLLDRRAYDRAELQDHHATLRRDLEAQLAAKSTALDDERRRRATGESEQEQCRVRIRDEERALARAEFEPQLLALSRKQQHPHDKEEEEVLEPPLRAAQSQNQNQSTTTIARLQQREGESHLRSANTTAAQDTTVGERLLKKEKEAGVGEVRALVKAESA